MSALPLRVTETYFPAEAELLEVAQQAAASHLHLITNGRETKLSPFVPPGWQKLAVHLKDAP